MAVPDSLTERLDLFASSGRFYKRAAAELFREESWVQVLLGQGFAMGHDPNAAMVSAEVRTSFLTDIEEVNRRCRGADARSRRLHRSPLQGAADRWLRGGEGRADDRLPVPLPVRTCTGHRP